MGRCSLTAHDCSSCRGRKYLISTHRDIIQTLKCLLKWIQTENPDWKPDGGWLSIVIAFRQLFQRSRPQTAVVTTKWIACSWSITPPPYTMNLTSPCCDHSRFTTKELDFDQTGRSFFPREINGCLLLPYLGWFT